MIALLRQWKAVIAVLVLFAVVGGWWAIRTHYIDMGRAECQAKVQRAIQQQQAVANENATIYEAGKTERQVEYRDRVREVVRYVESNRACDWSDDAFRMLNSAITGANTAGNTGDTLPGSPDYRITKPAFDGSLDRNDGRHVPGLSGEAQGDREGRDQ